MTKMLIFSESELEQRLNKAIDLFQSRIQRKLTPHRRFGKVYEYVKLHEPCAYYHVAGDLQIGSYKASFILAKLFETGWLKRAGRAKKRYKFKRGAKLYRVVDAEIRNKKLFDSWRAQLYKEVDLIDHYLQIPNCMLNRVSLEKATSKPLRDWEIFDKRLKGRTLQSIANDYGVSRERIRQIVDKFIER